MRKKKQETKNMVGFLVFFLICFLGGIGGGFFISRMKGESSKEILLMVSLLFLIAGVYLQMILHEGGHLIMGLLSGYEFVSFRIGSLMLVKTQEGMKHKRFSLAGTGGQCLLNPPDMKEETFPFVLYNLGGVLMNLLVSLAGVAVCFLPGGMNYGKLFCGMLAGTGFYLALMNGIPLHIGGVDNDGRNIQVLRRDPKKRRLFWNQLRMNAEVSKGTRLKDMPEEWFFYPPCQEMEDGIGAASGCFAVNRKIDGMDFSGAGKLGEQILKEADGILSIHRYMLQGEMQFLELLGVLPFQKQSVMENKEFKKFLKLTRNYPSTLRLRYAAALLGEKEEEEAAKIRMEFEKAAKVYPNQGELEGERELLELVDRHYEQEKNPSTGD